MDLSYIKRLPQALYRAEDLWEEQRQSCAPTADKLVSSAETLPEGCLYESDNLPVMAALAEMYTDIDVIYLDPPFDSRTNYQSRGQARGSGFRDTWGGSSGYIEMLTARLLAAHELLGFNGTLYLHLDWHAVHVAKLICDAIFGRKNFINEVIWWYNSGGGTRVRFGRKHDTILVYAKEVENYYFDADAVRVPYSAAIARSRAADFHPRGKVAPDVWDIPRPPNHAAEWTGWATQKPLALLERIVSASCPPGGTVADFFAGSGTTGAAVQACNQRIRDRGDEFFSRVTSKTFLLCEREPAATQIIRQRLGQTEPADGGELAEPVE